MNYTNQIIRHKDADASFLDRVIALKQSAWPYPKESQTAWMHENLKDGDLHVILMQEGKDVAYMNLVVLTFIVNNNTEYLAYGIENVCAAVKGKGYGGEIMKQVESYLKTKHRCGLLFCKSALIPFYERYGWKEVKREACKAPVLAGDIHIMTYMAPERIIDFNYQGRLFCYDSIV